MYTSKTFPKSGISLDCSTLNRDNSDDKYVTDLVVHIVNKSKYIRDHELLADTQLLAIRDNV